MFAGQTKARARKDDLSVALFQGRGRFKWLSPIDTTCSKRRPGGASRDGDE